MKEKSTTWRILKIDTPKIRTINISPKLSDEKLVVKALENADYFAQLIDRYEKKLFAYIKRLGYFTDPEAEDILQEVFIKTYQNLNDFDQSLKFSSWIYRIAHNHTISQFRKDSKHQGTLSLEDNQILYDKLASEENIKERVDKKILSEQIQSLIQHLPEKYREILILKYLEDKSYEEISNILKKPMGTVATLLSRAKKALKYKLTPYI
ncbi:sigma-70 family RNA polymerase sigma factor [Patescibacteria group bacterium]|nr:sigma-70 family RNA polymerase sigma factor [Patescibacteria group bacterium]